MAADDGNVIGIVAVVEIIRRALAQGQIPEGRMVHSMGWSPDAEKHRNSASGNHVFGHLGPILGASWGRFPRVEWFTVWGNHQMLKNIEIQHLVTTSLGILGSSWEPVGTDSRGPFR